MVFALNYLNRSQWDEPSVLNKADAIGAYEHYCKTWNIHEDKTWKKQ